MNFLLIIVFTSVISYSLSPFIIRIAKKLNLFDEPSSRKHQKEPIPRVGGLSIYFAFFIVFLINIFFSDLSFFKYFSLLENNQIITIFITISLFFVLGFLDDVKSLNPFLRLILQIVFVKFFIINFYPTNNLPIYLIINNILWEIPFYVFFILSIIWIAGITNSINWLDGLDSLANSSTLTISSAILSIAIFSQFSILEIISSLIIGACIGFLPSNRFPAKVYMGDGGSYFLGSSIAIMTLLILISDYGMEINIRKIFSVILILLIPLLDMVFVIFRRINNKKSPFYPDMSHLHHRLLEKGFSKKNTLLIINSGIIISSSLGIILNGTNLSLFSFFMIFNIILLYIYSKSDINLKNRNLNI